MNEWLGKVSSNDDRPGNYTSKNEVPTPNTPSFEANFRIGFWVSERKAKRLNFDELVKKFRNLGMELCLANMQHPISQQGPFNAIIHKAIEHLIKSDQGSVFSKTIVDDFENYMQKHPELLVIDPLVSLRRITDRSQQYQLIVETGLTRQKLINVPTFVSLLSNNYEENLKRIKAAKVKFPCVCKPLMADGTNLAHKMALIFNEEGLKDVNPPCVAQTFVNHNAILFKVFVIGQKYYIVERPSLKNFFFYEQPTIFFSTDEVSKSDSKSSLTKLDDKDDLVKCPNLDKEKLDTIVQVITKDLKLSLYGIDIIIEKDTENYSIIDMNPFPSYDGIGNFPELLAGYVLQRLLHQKQILHINRIKSNS